MLGYVSLDRNTENVSRRVGLQVVMQMPKAEKAGTKRSERKRQRGGMSDRTEIGNEWHADEALDRGVHGPVSRDGNPLQLDSHPGWTPSDESRPPAAQPNLG